MKTLPHPRSAIPALVAVLLSCSGDSPTGAGRAPAQFQAAGGGGQAGTVGTALAAPLVVRATDASGRGMRGVAVSWSIRTGGGTLATASGTTDDAGEARTQWTLGPTAGEQGVTATVQGLAPVFLAAVAAPDAPAAVRISAGDGQSAMAWTSVATAPQVRVADRYDNPVRGVEVRWAVTAGGGSVSPPASTTDAAGTASARWTLGPAVGAQGMSATVGGLPAAVLTATATPTPLPARVEASGDGQSGTVGEPLGDSLTVRVLSAEGKPVPGVTVAWKALEGAVSSPSAPTGETGAARVRWTLGGGAGSQAVEARVAALDGPPVMFRAAARAGPTATLKKTLGDAQRGAVGLELAIPLRAEAADRFGNPVEGVRANWTAGQGGSVSSEIRSTYPGGGTLGRWTLGPAEGPQTATVTVEGITAEFTATAGPVVPVASITLSRGPTLTLAEGFPDQVGATLRDAAGNELGGRTVTWSTSAPGVATVRSTGPGIAWVTPVGAGTTTITASAEGRSAGLAVVVHPGPKLTGLSRTPAAVEVGSAPATVEFTVSATDAGPGIDEVNVDLVSPSGGRYAFCSAGAPSSGTPANGVWKCTLTMRQGAEAGTWTIHYLGFINRARTQVGIRGDSLESMGYPTTVAVSNAVAPAPRPVLTGLSISPAAVDVTQADGKVEFLATVNSSAGASGVAVLVSNPPYGTSCNGFTLVAGTVESGTWKCVLEVPRTFRSGTWTVDLYITDRAGGSRSYNGDALKAAGFPSTFVVTSSSADGAARRPASRTAPRPRN